MASAKMKPPLNGFTILWLLNLLVSVVYAQLNLGQKTKQEIFFLNLEDGYFGCQVNETVTVLQLFELSRLCDGTPNCYLGSDENIRELKCTNTCPYTKGHSCINGACLDGQCHCNDGYGGCGCEDLDENECKYRPCDVFASCTNTLGSFYCTCYPGYEGDGHTCKDIDECLDRTIAAQCVENAWCCNLPAHYTCKCNEGFTGDGYSQCVDINECANPSACGDNAICSNLPGNYTCTCPEGYLGNPFNGCADLDECLRDNACGPQAKCKNREGGHACDCPLGYEGDPYSRAGCVDINECATSPCARGALCSNGINNFTCACPPGYFGDPYNKYGECQDIDECIDPVEAKRVKTNSSKEGIAWTFPCGKSSSCINNPGSYECKCSPGFIGDPRVSCTDINECAMKDSCAENSGCLNIPGSFKCFCPKGFRGNGVDNCTNVNECQSNPCGPNAKCIDNIGSYDCQCHDGYVGDPYRECQDQDECLTLSRPCGPNAICKNTVPSYLCECPQGFAPKPTAVAGCEQVTVNIGCQSNFDCVNNAICNNGQCFCREGFEADGSTCRDLDECLNSPCGSHATCQNIPGSYQCACNVGFVGNPPEEECKDLNECLSVPFPCGTSSKCSNYLGSFNCSCPNGLVGDPLKKCMSPCEGVNCGSHATCQPQGTEAVCLCNDGWSYDPMDISAGCVDVNECDPSKGPSGLCGRGAICTNIEGSFKCECPTGFAGNPHALCLDVNECLGYPFPCGKNAKCTNTAGGFSCSCLSASLGDPFEECDVDECRKPDACGIGAKCTNTPGSFTCECPLGTIAEPDPYTECLEIMTCEDDDDCPGNALCLATQCMCPEPNIGDDCRHPCEDVRCGSNSECKLINGVAKCLCEDGYQGSPSKSRGCVDINECDTNPCGQGAICKNELGHFTCECPSGFEGSPAREGCVQVKSPGCSPLSPCPLGEQCINDPEVGDNVCVCQRGYVRDEATGKCRDINECLEQRGRPSCGLNAICKNLPGSYDCQCPPKFVGNPFNACQECDSLECRCQPPYKIINGKCVLSNCSLGNVCPPGAECVSIQGGVSYCACPSGFTTLGDGSCQDVDECSERRPDGSLPCGLNSECHNEIGKYRCTCPPGTSGDPYGTGCSTDKVQCSNDGDCRDNERCVQPGKCVCPPPYFVDNLDDNRCKSPCQAFSCGINSKCTPTDPPQCLCVPGFASSGINGCVDVDECKTNPCAKGAICHNELGTYKCECPPGLIGDAYKGNCASDQLQQPPACRRDTDCPNELKCDNGECVSPCDDLPCGRNAYCEANTHARYCRCLPGYVEGSSGECVSLCDGFLCGKNAKCIVANDGPTCKCEDNFLGNPFPGGSCSPDMCSASNPCDDPKICVNGRCKERCEGIVCGVGAKCDKLTNKCICLPYFLGDPNLLCVPPVTPPLCAPGCGANAHCEYGQPNRCLCNTGYSGNPYETCVSQIDKADCATTKCGTNAICKQGQHRVDCACPVGYRGNPYVECTDVDECIGDACGMNAICLNTPGSFDCRCQAGFSGNPFVMCMPSDSATDPCDVDPNLCGCNSNSDCTIGNICKNGKCADACKDVICGPNEACSEGSCRCLPGFTKTQGQRGCQPPSECRNDLDCKDNEICFSITGQRRCVDACLKVECGANSICVSQNHRSSCLCKQGYVPIPNDRRGGCQLEDRESECEQNSDCSPGLICQIDLQGIKGCADPCLSLVCGQNELCYTSNGQALCKCTNGYIRNPSSNECQKPGIPDCTSDAQCPSNTACVPDNLGVNKCIDVCRDFTCGLHSFCTGINHRGQCQCKEGFSGNPNDRSGCRPIPQDECRTDSQCPETGICKQQGDSKKCIAVCDGITCGPGAVCVAKNHAAQCQCPPGLFAGDPQDPSKGCQSVGCLINEDCPFDQACDRLNFRCFDVCFDACGDNAICIPENHRYNCKCPPGSVPNPSAEIQCSSVKVCDPNPCHQTAKCVPYGGNYKCNCHPGMVGDPFVAGCHPEGMCPNGDVDCPPDSVCINGRCSSPCDKACGLNSICTVANRIPECSCPAGFEPNETPQRGCSRIALKCSSDTQCSGGVCLNGQCHFVCRNAEECAQNEKCIEKLCQVPCVSSNQCLKDQACISGVCVIGCRSNSECPGNNACINSKCIDPCSKPGVCGPNANCKADGHIATCECPINFKAPLSAQQGCIRLPSTCENEKDCPINHQCENGVCMAQCQLDSQCAQGERCVKGMCMKVCFNNGNCIQGEVCIDSSCVPGCNTKSDCLPYEVCISNKCMCAKGYVSGPTGCVDIDECEDGPCDLSAECTNVPGSFKCSCPPGTVRDASGTACEQPYECQKDVDCPGEQACVLNNNNGMHKCVDPCASSVCGKNAFCKVEGRKPFCECNPGHYGDPSNLSIGCVQGECVNDDDCLGNKACDHVNFKCIDPCDTLNCRYGRCQTTNHKASCYCETGFQVDPTTGSCIDVNECLENPCHRTAECRNNIGSFSCQCPGNNVGDPYTNGCRTPGTCSNDNECPQSAMCSNGICRSPCEITTCGLNAKCIVTSHKAECFCPPLTSGNPLTECAKLECDDIISFCKPGHSCMNNKCIGICDLPGTCGKNAECNFRGTLQTCTCRPGYTGDPILGCTAVLSCASESDCPAGEQCNGGICVPSCSSNRECLHGQVCISGSCIPTCRGNNECPELQVCQNNICIPELKCLKDADCNDVEVCNRNAVGQAQCNNACDGLVICGRNAQCESGNHKAVCKCPERFYGDPMDEKIGCKEIQCNSDDECGSTELCEEYQCKVACRSKDNCGENAICLSENHKAVCFCRNGYEGDPLQGCNPIDFCKKNPCAIGAECAASFGSFRCSCPLGTVGDPYSDGCNKPVGCINNNDCDGFAFCSVADGQKCKAVCEERQCGSNAECHPVNHQAVCRCRSGYEGDPERGCRPEVVSCNLNADCPPNTICDGGLCRPPCQSNNECGLNEACIKGQCSNICDQDKPCGVNAQCQIVNHEKKCSCPPEFTGDAKIECYRIPGACRQNSDCLSGFTCQSGVCTPVCSNDKDCAQNEKCVTSMCHLTCRVDNDCFLGHICLNNICSIGCRANTDCASTESCINSQCSDTCKSGSVCGPNSKCQVLNHRAQCSCPSGFIPNPTPNIACSREPVLCNLNSDCQNGYVCHSGTCIPICSSSANCLGNELCDGYVCRPVCSKDDDCRSGEICNNAMCVAGCRSNSECLSTQACINRKCSDPCSSPTACGVNAICATEDNKAKCECPTNMVGNAFISCRVPPTSCSTDTDCPADMSCIAEKCKPRCTNDQACMDNERCIGSVCKEICNSNSQCGSGYICLGRVCIAGCRADLTCPNDQACINKKCLDPCQEGKACGACAKCKVVGHRPQCSCPANTIGNPAVSCTVPQRTCSSSGQCSGTEACEGGYCFEKCDGSTTCQCGNICSKGFCRPQCDIRNQCNQGFLCKNGACVAGCRTNSDCPLADACINENCEDPCQSNPCGKGATCRSSDHRAICICPDGFHGDAYVECKQYECLQDSDCTQDKACVNRECKNICLLGKCGTNAHCKVIQHVAECSCPANYFGNPTIECKQDVNECLGHPCANNAQCSNTVGSYKCTCDNGCHGDPYEAGCLCPQEQVRPCARQTCGLRAKCRETNDLASAECFCPPAFPLGDPSIQCSSDCRQSGCGLGAECKTSSSNTYECICNIGWSGNPLVECVPAIGCKANSDCPPKQACINDQCQNPCVADNPCNPDSDCKVEGQIAICIAVGCRANSDCPTKEACVNEQCISPCEQQDPCEDPEECQVRDHIAFCISACKCTSHSDCPPGYACDGCTCRAISDPPVTCTPKCRHDERCDPNRLVCVPEPADPIGCRSDDQCGRSEVCRNRICIDPCALLNPCAPNAECRVVNKQPQCSCPDGKTGDPKINCYTMVPRPARSCNTSIDCFSADSCLDLRCQNPCLADNPCSDQMICKPYLHKGYCYCPAGYKGQLDNKCVSVVFDQPECTTDPDCSTDKACYNQHCDDPCVVEDPCGRNAKCRVQQHRPICYCPDGWFGDPTNQCFKVPACPLEKGFIINSAGECECPHDKGFYVDQNGNCQLCPNDKGFVLTSDGRCICDPEKGYVLTRLGICDCPLPFARTDDGNCVLVTEAPLPPICTTNEECPQDRMCENNECVRPCSFNPCSLHATCINANHTAVCYCLTGYEGDPYVEQGCRPSTPVGRTDFPRPTIVVNCLADGVQVQIHIGDPGFNGVMYVKGYSKNEECRRVLRQDIDVSTIDFKVKFNTCGLVHENGLARFMLVIQKHPKLVTYDAQAYHVKCTYSTGEKTISLGFNVSMLTTAGTIANTGPPPICKMEITSQNGKSIDQAEIGDLLLLNVKVEPSDIYGGFARSCVALTSDDEGDNEYTVTDENGCATDPIIFQEWRINDATKTLEAPFSAFKFPSSNSIRFQCNVRVCFGRCQPVNCNGYDAFGRRRRRQVVDPDAEFIYESESSYDGQMREIQVSSQAILTVERRSERLTADEDLQGRIDEVCVSKWGFIIALIITALLALVAVAVAVSCWLMAYRRRPRHSGPLPHPEHFPNPLFTTPEPLAEPSPDYLS